MRGVLEKGNKNPLQFNCVGKGSDARPPQTGFARQLPLYDLRFASVDKGSDAYQTTYRDINEKSSCISGKLSLLSKGLRGGKERSDRVVSLLRWMIASEDAKNPLKARKQKGIQGYSLLYPPERKGL
ncbi:MAG: hypothetical protein CL920_34595 [Deltaproteobacteria bacterium]|nr:hypothetical protein [Deltaproteobacteria bacterium]